MGQGVALVIIMVFLTMLFFSSFQLQQNRIEVTDIKQSLNLSAKALAKAVDQETLNKETISLGFTKANIEVSIDHDLLLEEFYKVLYQNYYHQDRFQGLKKSILLKVLVYYDRFYIADLQDRWSPPCYFNVSYEGNIYYLTTLDGQVYTYDEQGEKRFLRATDIEISDGEQEQLIIDKINTEIANETSRYNRGIPLVIEIKNPEIEDFQYLQKYGHFNVLEGVTFFVIYGERKTIGIDQKQFQFSNHNVVGYTLEIERGITRE